jgi:pentatricopeptide repeat protein
VAAEIAAKAPGIVQFNVFACNRKLTKHVKDGQLDTVMQLFQQMRQQGAIPNKFTFIQVIKACAALRTFEHGRLVHKQLVQTDCECDVFVGSSLVDMYAKCGSIDDAWSVQQDAISKCGHLEHHDIGTCEMWARAEGTWTISTDGTGRCVPDSVTFVGVLKACASMVAIEEGRCVHQDISQSSLESDVFVGSSLVNMYAKCGSMEDAWRVFNKSFFKEKCFVKENTEPFGICRNVVFSTWNLQN